MRNSAAAKVMDMATSYRAQDPKKQISARVRGSIHVKLARIVELWREKADAAGDDVEEIDLTYVIDALLADKTDEELAQWGGMPKTPEAAKAQVDAVRAAGSKKSSK